MFITRRRYEADLEKARAEVAEKIWQEQSRNERITEINQRIDRLGEAVARIEKQINQPLTIGFEGGRK